MPVRQLTTSVHMDQIIYLPRPDIETCRLPVTPSLVDREPFIVLSHSLPRSVEHYIRYLHTNP